MNHQHEQPNGQHTGWASPSRRAVISSGALGLAALALAGCEKHTPQAASPTNNASAGGQSGHASGAPGLTTLDARIVAGDKLDPKKPYRRLALDGPQKMVVREDLYLANSNRAAARKALVAFGHITDTHIMDPTSPAHVSLLDPSRPPSRADASSLNFRPQDSLTVQVMDAMIRRLNAVRRGPATKRPFDCYISTGDASDNRSTDEVHAFIDTMNGKETSAYAFPGYSNSMQSPTLLPESFARFVWQPDPPKGSTASRIWQDVYGFPSAKHLLANASQPVAAEGANVPWYSGFGNHDSLAHRGGGELESAVETFYSTLATTNKLILGLPHGITFEEFGNKLASAAQPEIKKIIASMPGRLVKASADRRPMTKTEFMAAHMIYKGPQGPVGHGFTETNVRKGTAYYRFQLADGIVGIMLDTTDSTGGGNGSIDSKQATWLKNELDGVSRIHYDDNGEHVHHNVKDQIVVIFSHHPSPSFGPLHLGFTDKTAITSPDSICDLLARYPNVLLWVNGHYHLNIVWPRKSRYGKHGFWEINTASHIDFPQQSRSIEIIDNNDTSLSIVSVMIDHSDAAQINYEREFSPSMLASFSAELALNSPNPNTASRAGSDKNQNVELLLKKPF